jgi:hypothetical protein
MAFRRHASAFILLTINEARIFPPIYHFQELRSAFVVLNRPEINS